MHLAAGMAAGVVNTVVTNPLDTMKVRVQCQIGAEGGAFRTIANMVRKEGAHPSTRPRAPAPPARPTRARAWLRNLRASRRKLESHTRRPYGVRDAACPISTG